MYNAIKHRGPDDSGIFVDCNIILDHQRLSIIDLNSVGKQASVYNHKNNIIIIVFNGIIYIIGYGTTNGFAYYFCIYQLLLDILFQFPLYDYLCQIFLLSFFHFLPFSPSTFYLKIVE